MCFTISIYAETHTVETDTCAVFDDNSLYTPYYNVTGFIHPDIPLITADDSKRISMMKWGLIPRWVKDWEGALSIRSMTLNARSETAFVKPSFKDAIAKRRALLPVNGFIEWRQEEKLKIPHYVKAPSQNLFTIGCVWEQWLNKSDGELFSTFSILTTQANELMSYVHNTKQRMPVIVSTADRLEWLNNSDPESINKLMRPYPDDELIAYPLDKEVSKYKTNTTHPELIERIE